MGSNSSHTLIGALAIVTSLASGVAAQAADARSPLRGTWSFSQQVPSTTLLTGSPVPLVAVGTLNMDRYDYFTGHGVFNTPVPGNQSIELDLNGNCTARSGEPANGYDCVFNFPAFNLMGVNRYCVAMDNTRGRCFDALRCVNIDEPGETVALIEYRRQHSGTCE